MGAREVTKRSQILAVDIGNTTIGLAVVQNGKILVSQRCETTDNSRVLKPLLQKAFKRLRSVVATAGNLPFTQAVICSVVPKVTALVEAYIREISGVSPQVMGRDLKVPIINRYRNPRQVGQDRLVGAYAAMKLYGFGGKPLIVVDLGTAITFDVVSSKSEYLGGVIVPGLRLSAESLFLKTALLPKIAIKAPKSVIGQTTQESILSGLFYGYGCLCRGMIDLLSRESQQGVKVIMTGGHTGLMKRFISPKIRIVDEDLVFKGMGLLLK